MPNEALQTLLQQLMAVMGNHVGTTIREQINALINTHNIDVQALQDKIAVLQSILDSDPDTEEFDVAQNIIAQIQGILQRLSAVESTLNTLTGDETVPGSIDAKIAAERQRAQASEQELRDQIEELSGGGDNSSSSVKQELDSTQVGAGLEEDGSYAADSETTYIDKATSLKDADKKLDAAIADIEARKANISDVVTSSGVSAINATALGQVFLDAINCALSGGTDCGEYSTGGDNNNDGGDGDGAVL